MSAPQPTPEHVPGAVSVHDLVARDAGRCRWWRAVAVLDDRYRVGIATYGTPLTVEEGRRDPIRDGLEELADAAVYFYRAWKRGTGWARYVYWACLWLTEYVARKAEQ